VVRTGNHKVRGWGHINFVFRSFTLLVAINNSKCVGKLFYEKGGRTKERMAEFIETQIAPKYKDHLIILDNAKSHNNNIYYNSLKHYLCKIL
jgi:hypothetical protein